MTRTISTPQLFKAFWNLLWIQHRKTLIKCATGCLGAIAATYLLVAAVHSMHAPFKDSYPFLFPIAAFTFIGYDLTAMKLGGMIDADDPMAAARGTMTPTFTLPVNTRLLVLVPYTIRSLAVCLPWLLFSLAALLPAKLDAPVFQTNLVLLVTVSAIQASSWMIRYRSGIGCLFLMVSLFSPAITVMTVWLRLPEWYGDLLCVMLIGLAVWSMLTTAPAVRCSDASPSQLRMSEKARAKDAVRAAKQDAPKQTTALGAQIWFRLKQKQPLITTMMAGSMFFMFILMKAIAGAVIPMMMPGPEHELSDMLQTTLPGFFFFALLLFVFVMPIEQQGAIREGKFVLNSGLDPFIAIRPISTSSIVLSTIYTTLVGGCFLTLVLVAGIIMWQITPGGRAPLEALAANMSTARVVGLIVFCLASAPIVIASGQFYTATFRLLGERIRKVFSYAWPFLIFVSVFTIFAPLMPHMGHGQDESPFDPTLLLSFASVALAGKLVLAAIGWLKLMKNGLLSKANGVKAVGLYAALVCVMSLVLSLLYPHSPLTPAGITVIVATLAPMNRYFWHIVLLDQKRHV